MYSSTLPKIGSFSLSSRMGVALFLLSAATLAFEINLTRLFSVAQFYHFAFLVVSMSMLGIGASGTFLAIVPALPDKAPQNVLRWIALASSISMLAAYLLINWLPFDSFSIAWDRRQIVILALNYLGLVTPFFFCGLAVSLMLTSYSEHSRSIYSINLLGSSFGCLCALILPPFLGGEGIVSWSSALAAFAALCLTGQVTSSLHRNQDLPTQRSRRYEYSRVLALFVSLGILAIPTVDIGLRLTGRSGIPFMDLRLSPYKSLSYALQYPGAQITLSRWNSFSRVDRVQSKGIRSLPGLSYRYLQLPPSQDGIFIDGDDLSPIITDASNLNFAQFFPSYLAFTLRPESKALILEPRGGLDILIAIAGYAQHVTAIEVNPLIVQAAAPIYQAPGVQTIFTSDRVFLSQSEGKYDVIVLSLASSYHPVRSGAYSLVEDYRYTLEAMLEMIKHLDPGGLLVVSRWIQTPPSESLRAFTLATTALRQLGANPGRQIMVMRGFNTATLFIKNGAYTQSEIESTREFAAKRAFDLDYFPEIQPGDTNRYNILPDSMDYMVYQEFLQSDSPDHFYSAYPFDVRPPTDDRPFFSHSFKWEQTSQVIAEMGKTWQPFGGAGYFVVIVLLALACVAAILLILLPLVFSRVKIMGNSSLLAIPSRIRISALLYFSSIGLAYLFVEIPLIQRFILYLGSPAYAMTTVLFTLLLFSGWGSQLSGHIPAHTALILLGIILLLVPHNLHIIFDWSLESAPGLKQIISILLLAPIGFLMGIPFPAGITSIIRGYNYSSLIPWLWAVNGAASVIASILAALLALNWGFSSVLYVGAAAYIAAWITGRVSIFQPPLPRPVR